VKEDLAYKSSAGVPRLGNPHHFSKAAVETQPISGVVGTSIVNGRKSDNLLVALDAAAPPLRTKASLSTERQGMWQEVQNGFGQSPQIKLRYTTKQLLLIFRSCGRF